MAPGMEMMRARPNNKRRPQFNRLRPVYVRISFWLWLLFWGMLGVLAVWGVIWLREPTTLPIRQIIIRPQGAELNQAVLRRVIVANLQGGFFSLDVAQMKQAVSALPWVASVSVRRVWPATVKIEVTQQKALAIWNQSQLLNPLGKLFKVSPTTFPKNLPRLYGVSEDSQLVWQNYQQFQQILSTLHLPIVQLWLTARHAWHLLLANKTQVILGREQVDMRLQRFVKVYPRLLKRHKSAPIYVDLRYPNGFVVKWRH